MPVASTDGAGVARNPGPAVRVATAPGSTPPVAPRLRVLNPGTAADIADHSADEPAAPPAVTDDDDLDPSGTRADWFPPGSVTFRTVCVRLCDGAMTPISFATSKDRLALDALRCRRSCSGPTRLYVERNRADESGRLVDLDGKPYEALPSAYKFRTSYDAACTCRAHAWETAATIRHRMLALVDRVAGTRQQYRGPSADLRKAALLAAGPSGRKVIATTVSSAPAKLRRAPPAPASTQPLAEVAAADAMPAAIAELTTQQRRGKSKQSAAARAKALEARVLKATALLAGSKQTLRHAELGRRRFDGTDWRISLFEPL